MKNIKKNIIETIPYFNWLETVQTNLINKILENIEGSNINEAYMYVSDNKIILRIGVDIKTKDCKVYIYEDNTVKIDCIPYQYYASINYDEIIKTIKLFLS